MFFTSSTRIVTESILNEDTGEINKKDFIEVKKTKNLRGGFVLMYPTNYDEVMAKTINSNKEMLALLWIKNSFTFQKVEVPITFKYAKEDGLEISKRQFSQLVKKLVEVQFLMRVSRGMYRMNPFIYIPYKADGELLQKEWNDLKEIS